MRRAQREVSDKSHSRKEVKKKSPKRLDQRWREKGSIVNTADRETGG